MSFGLRHTQSFANNEYRNGHYYETDMNQGDTYVYGEYRGKVKKLDYRLGVGVTRSYYKQSGDDSYENYSFNPRLVLHYALPGNSFVVSIRPRACFSPSYNKVKSQTKHVWLLTLL